MPDVFVIQLQRFAMYPKMRKIRGLIRYPEALDMSGYINHGSEELLQCKYNLTAIAVHMGSINAGHYVAYVKKEDGLWYYVNDERVSKVQLYEVLNQDAYMLFYQKNKL